MYRGCLQVMLASSVRKDTPYPQRTPESTCVLSDLILRLSHGIIPHTCCPPAPHPLPPRYIDTTQAASAWARHPPPRGKPPCQGMTLGVQSSTQQRRLQAAAAAAATVPASQAAFPCPAPSPQATCQSPTALTTSRCRARTGCRARRSRRGRAGAALGRTGTGAVRRWCLRRQGARMQALMDLLGRRWAAAQCCRICPECIRSASHCSAFRQCMVGCTCHCQMVL